MRPSFCCAIFLLLVPAVASAAKVEFNRDIRPILSDKCFACHGPDAEAKKIRLRLDSESRARADLGGHFAIVPGAPERSELVRRITAEKPAQRMPPAYSGVALTPKEIALLRQWIAEGAEWQKHWSFLPPVRRAVPQVKQTSWVRNPIDAFVLSRLEEEGLKPSPEAERLTLLRRVSFDLTGLPPTPEEADRFLADSSADAYEKQVDRLLNSPRFGEKMAHRWLDAARYADTNGYQTDAERHMWRWRDWVIDAFNRNKPFDQFVTEQIAGDLLPNATMEQKIATGFNRNHRGNSEGGIVPEEYLAEYAVDRVDTMSTVFLGVTLGCARCHNHKYDPFTQREYYQLFAYFNNIPELGRYLKFGNTPPFVKAPTEKQQKSLAELDQKVKAAEGKFTASRTALMKACGEWEKTITAAMDWGPGEGLDYALKREVAGEYVAGDKGAFGFYDRFTAAAWVRTDSASGPLITRADTEGEGEGWGLYLDGGKLQVNLIKRRLDDSIRVETKRPIPLKQWRHVAMTYDGSRLASGVRVYVDGVEQELTILLDAINQDFLRKDQPLRLGAGGIMEARFQGQIRDVRVYRRALPMQEVQMLALPESLAQLASMPVSKRTPAQAARLERACLDLGAPEELQRTWRDLTGAREARSRFVDEIPTVMVMEELPVPKPTHILVRGAYDRPGEAVTRGVPEVLPPLPPGAPPDRLGLAQWLVSAGNPLTARVTVNRFWQMLFGAGIVRTVEDFGSQGEWPSHPDLLDWLALEFVESGWNVKRLLKTVVTSATYRQSSAARPELTARDPENRLLARGVRMRLPAESIRDMALASSGLLVERIGGPSVKPYQPAGIWSELAGGEDYQRDKGPDLYRRTVYTYWKRTAPPPFPMNFDHAGRESCVVRESRTNTPLQALNLMNDVTFVEASRALAQRAIKAADAPSDRIRFVFRSLLTREPDAGEQRKLAGSLNWFRQHFASDREGAIRILEQGDAPVDASADPAELAAYTAVASLVMNLDEAITKE